MQINILAFQVEVPQPTDVLTSKVHWADCKCGANANGLVVLVARIVRADRSDVEIDSFHLYSDLRNVIA